MRSRAQSCQWLSSVPYSYMWVLFSIKKEAEISPPPTTRNNYQSHCMGSILNTDWHVHLVYVDHIGAKLEVFNKHYSILFLVKVDWKENFEWTSGSQLELIHPQSNFSHMYFLKNSHRPPTVSFIALSLANMFNSVGNNFDFIGNKRRSPRRELYWTSSFPSSVCTVPSSGPQNLRVSEEWYNRLRITWDPPSAPVKGYRIVYKPVSGKVLLEPRVDSSRIFF